MGPFGQVSFISSITHGPDGTCSIASADSIGHAGERRRPRVPNRRREGEEGGARLGATKAEKMRRGLEANAAITTAITTAEMGECCAPPTKTTKKIIVG